MKLNFITSNKGKVASLKRYLDSYNVNCEIEARDLKIIEPQLNTVTEVSRSKAMQAFELLKEPIVVEDGGFYIEALKNFPGVYTKYILETIGVDGIIKLLEGEKNRRARFCSCVTYIDKYGKIFQFSEELEDSECGCYFGNIAEKKAVCSCPHAWSDIWFIYKPKNSSKTMAELNLDELNKIEKGSRSNNILKFVEWLSNSNS